MSAFSKTHLSKDGYHLECEFENFPVTFVNGLRRILLGGLPVVVIRDVVIIENTTQMPHEMLKHRIEMLPVNVQPTDSEMIKNVQIELMQTNAEEEPKIVTTDDFTVQSGRDNVLMKDRDWNTPVIVMKLRKGEKVRLTGRLTVEKKSVSHVCTATTSWKVDPELAKLHKKKFVEDGGNPKVFDNFYIQKSFYKDDAGRPSWITLHVESVGVIKSVELLQMAVSELKSRIDAWMDAAKEKITRESEPNVYHVALDEGEHTIGSLLQDVMYHHVKSVSYCSYDIPHPLLPGMILRFLTESAPEDVLKELRKKLHDYCTIVETVL